MHWSRIGLCLLTVSLPVFPAHAQMPMDVRMVEGACQAGSSVKSGTDTKPYVCDNAIFAFYDNANSHVMIQFVQKNDEYGAILGFAGAMAGDGLTLNVERISLLPGKPEPAQQASCKLSFTPSAAGNGPPNISGIECRGEVDAQKTALTVLFKPNPGQ